MGIALSQRLDSASSLGTASPSTSDGGDSSRGALEHIYFVDVEGWYSITPFEVAVRNQCDLAARSNEEMTAALPTELGERRQATKDVDLTDDPAVAAFSSDPKVARRRSYQDRAGHTLTLVLIGNEGAESFALFSQTPEICQPGGLWELGENRRDSAPLGERPMYARYLSVIASRRATGWRFYSSTCGKTRTAMPTMGSSRCVSTCFSCQGRLRMQPGSSPGASCAGCSPRRHPGNGSSGNVLGGDRVRV